MNDPSFATIQTLLYRDTSDGGQFHSGYVSGWSSSRWERLETGRLHEDDYSALLIATTGRIEDALVSYFLDAGKQERLPSRRYRLVKASDLSSLRRLRDGKPTRRVPDFFVASTASDTSDTTMWTPEIAVEAKFSAHVNDGWSFCPAGRKHGQDRGYSNQIVCYAENCWLSEDSISPKAYVWLAGRQTPDPIETKGVTTRDAAENATLGAFKLVQDRCWSTWFRAYHEDIVGADGTLATGGAPEVAAYLRRCHPISSSGIVPVAEHIE